MSLNQSIFSRIFISLLLSPCIIINSSCSSTPDKQELKKDSIPLITLPEPPAISETEKNRIRLLSKNWFDSALKQRGFNGGMLVAKDGNIIFEEYSGTGH